MKDYINKDLKAELKKEINKATDHCMYDFPRSYNNSQIIAYQKGIDKMWSRILKRLDEIL